MRLLYLRAHYRAPIDFSDEGLADAAASLERLWAFRRRLGRPITAPPDSGAVERFRSAMDDDFNTAEAMAVLFEVVRQGNRHLDTGEDAEPLAAAYDEITGVLGLAEPAAGLDDLAGELLVMAEEYGLDAGPPVEIVSDLLDLRSRARRERGWAIADGIRDALAAIGIVLEDTPDGTIWHRQ